MDSSYGRMDFLKSSDNDSKFTSFIFFHFKVMFNLMKTNNIASSVCLSVSFSLPPSPLSLYIYICIYVHNISKSYNLKVGMDGWKSVFFILDRLLYQC